MRHNISVVVACHSTSHTQATLLKWQLVDDANEFWPTMSHLSSWPFPIMAAIGSIVVFMEVSMLCWVIHGSVYCRWFLTFDTSQFVRSPFQLLSELWLAATEPHAAQNRTGPICSIYITCGCSIAKERFVAWLWARTGAKFHKIHVGLQLCGMRLWLLCMSAAALTKTNMPLETLKPPLCLFRLPLPLSPP